MWKEMQTNTLRRGLALLLAVVMAVSGTGVTAFAADLPSDVLPEAAAPVEEAAETEVEEADDIPVDPSDAERPDPAVEEPQEDTPAEGENSEAPTAESAETVAEAESETAETEEASDEPDPEEPAQEEDPIPEAPEQTEAQKAQTPVSDGDHPLKEQAASNREPLLSDRELSAETKAMVNHPARRANGQQTSVSAGGMSIDKITVRWLTKSTGSDTPAGDGRLVLVTDTDKVANQQFQIDFALSGEEEHEAGSVELVFPAYIWLDRDGKEPGYLTLAVPEDPETGADFAWKRVGDSIVITNTHTLSAASKIMLQGTFRNISAHQMVDIDTLDQSAPYPGISDELSVTIHLTVPGGEVISLTSNSIDASVNTKIEASTAYKSAYNSSKKEYYVYHSVPSDLPAELRPENPDDYIYVRWYVSGAAKGGQPFTMQVIDTAEDAYGDGVESSRL